MQTMLLAALCLSSLLCVIGLAALWLRLHNHTTEQAKLAEQMPLLFKTLELTQQHQYQQDQSLQDKLHALSTSQTMLPEKLQQLLLKQFAEQQQLMTTLTQAQISKLSAELRSQLLELQKQSSEHLSVRFDDLIKTTDDRLQRIGGKVDKRLAEGFEKTNATFADVIKRLALIDQAQKRIAELSTDVISLQDLLSDKRARGAFGEVQLASLIRNTIPEQHFSLQHTFSNGKRVDCLLMLPEPTGNVAIDAKFPLENFQQLSRYPAQDANYAKHEKLFVTDIKKHITDIAERYIIPDETSAGAVMFIPAESIFAKIHSDFPQLVEFAHKLNVWLVSPTTMMAILTTARAVLKDSDTRKQVHIIQQHLACLSQDFKRFESRMDKLARHIDLAHEDVKLVNTSAKKITQRFTRIEQVELDPQDKKRELLINEEPPTNT